MNVSSREMVLGVVTVSVLLFGGGFLLVRPRLEAARLVRAQQAGVREIIDKNKRLVGSEDSWVRQFEEMRGMLPVQPAGQDVAVHWVSVMDAAARKHNLRILKYKAGQEEEAGDVFELPIDGREWEGDLPALIRFLFELQSEGAMLDVRYLQVKPKEGGQLRGRFQLYCAFMKGES